MNESNNADLNHNVPFVSIAMCTYNGAQFLEEQIKSILNQTYENIELVIVDDLSKDETPQILSKLLSNSKCRIIFNDQNCGVVANFEKAISFCTGQFIALCDQDDLWEKNKIELMVAGIKENVLLYHDSQIFSDQSLQINTKISEKLNFVRGKCSLSLAFRNCIPGHTMMFKSGLREYLTPTPAGMPHDWWIGYIAASIGTINYLPLALVKYRQHTNSHTDLFQLKCSTEKQDCLEEIVFEKHDRYRAHLPIFISYKYNDAEELETLKAIYHAYLAKEKVWYSIGLVAILLKNLKAFDVVCYSFPEKIFLALREGINTSIKANFKHFREKTRRFIKS